MEKAYPGDDQEKDKKKKCNLWGNEKDGCGIATLKGNHFGEKVGGVSGVSEVDPRGLSHRKESV